MESFITSYLIQKRECNLPRLGIFTIRQVPAILDVANKKIFPATDEIIFDEGDNDLSEGLKNYLSRSMNISADDAEGQLISWCSSARFKIDTGEKISLTTIGNLHKNEAGIIVFDKVNELNLFHPIAAERVIHKNTEHPVLVGDMETTSGAMNQFLMEEEPPRKRSPWKLRALILLAIAIILLIIFYSSHTFSIALVDSISFLHHPVTADAYYACQKFIF